MIELASLSAKRVIYIGGVSGSGKSVLAAALAAALPGHDLIRLDWIYNALHAARTHGGVKRSRRNMARLAPAIVAEVMDDVSVNDDRVIVEGGWVEPRAWQRLAAGNPAVYALYLGYPDASVPTMVERLGATGHWLNSGTANDRRFLADQITHSKRLRRKLAGRESMEFVDVSAGVAGFLTR